MHIQGQTRVNAYFKVMQFAVKGAKVFFFPVHSLSIYFSIQTLAQACFHTATCDSFYMRFSFWDCGTLCWFGSFVLVTIGHPSTCSKHLFHEDDPNEGGSTLPRLCPRLLQIPALVLVKITSECVAGKRFYWRGMCISPVYPPTPTTLFPPSLMETNSAQRKEDICATEVRGSSCPSSLSSSL